MTVPARGGVTGEGLAPGVGGGESAPAPAPVAAAAQLIVREVLMPVQERR